VDKADFLNDKDVINFMDHLADVLTDKITINHTIYSARIKINTFTAAFNSYCFPLKSSEIINTDTLAQKQSKKGFISNNLILDSLKTKLVKAKTGIDFYDAALDVLWWGAGGKLPRSPAGKRNGTYLKNKAWLDLKFPSPGRIGILQHFNSSKLESNKKIVNEYLFDENPYRMNAGFTKIYSLINDNFIIYDGRVGAALGLLVKQFCLLNGYTSVPQNLKFAWDEAEAAKGKMGPNRNPSTPTLIFPRLKRGSMWAESNIRANWLLEATLNKVHHKARSWSFCSQTRFDELRAIEASLFMIGYEVSPPTTTPTTKTESKKSQATAIYNANQNASRQTIIDLFIKQVGLTEKGASTYYQNIKNGVRK
jgi:hypothetical protein